MKYILFVAAGLLAITLSCRNLLAQNLNRQTFPGMEKENPRRIIRIPNPDGFITLKGDFHTHTVFSDGDVWPDTRIAEAWSDGLDVIAITDHDRYHPNADYLKPDNNVSGEIAVAEAASKGILLIRGVEVTRKMPPGHFNALFVKDANLPELNDTSRQAFLNSIEKLVSQGAVIIWNHPGWAAQQKDTVKWFEMHQLLLDRGWLHGIEVFNYTEWYPVALGWAMEKNLAPFANTDIHGPVSSAYYREDASFIRPMTLVFAKDKSEAGVREAIMNRHTVAWFNGHLAGQEKWLKALFHEALRFTWLPGTGNKIKLMVQNPTDLEFHLTGTSSEWKGEVVVKGNSETILTLPANVARIPVKVTNWHTGMRSNLETEIVTGTN